ncbi:hypothetical protein [Rouxiella badensis]|uniref:hypothetical protein n=1 Tax=Rouxiella badensis TaxID=1646377 RepID=UPI001788057F|nr:hypothetical protein [Rouxiella badensis]QOI57994.1 hypothetical protein H2866_22605 [Rouxiella badensis subsp. acadiensis]
MDTKKVKVDFNDCSTEVIKFLNNVRTVTYVSTLLVENNELSAHQSNGYNGWDVKFYYGGKYNDSTLIQVGLELTKIKAGDVSTVIWDDVLKHDPDNLIDIERRNHNIYHGISFIYGITDDMSMAINVCTGKDTSKQEFEDIILPQRFTMLHFFKDL